MNQKILVIKHKNNNFLILIDQNKNNNSLIYLLQIHSTYCDNCKEFEKC